MVSPIIFAPLPIPHNASGLSSLTFVGMLVVLIVLEHLGKPRSTVLWMLLGYIIGLVYGHGDMGGLLGSVVGIFLGLASARISARKS